MAKNEWLTETELFSLTLEELCENTGISSSFVMELVEYEVITPQITARSEHRIDVTQLQRIQTALRLQRDLEVNLSGIAIILDLLEERENLRNKIALLEKHYVP